MSLQNACGPAAFGNRQPMPTMAMGSRLIPISDIVARACFNQREGLTKDWDGPLSQTQDAGHRVRRQIVVNQQLSGGVETKVFLSATFCLRERWAAWLGTDERGRRAPAVTAAIEPDARRLRSNRSARSPR